MRTTHTFLVRLAAAGLLLSPALGFAQTISDNFTGAATTYSWTPLQGACLTAGNGSGTVPACVCANGVSTMCLTATGAYYNGITGPNFAGGFTGNGLPDTVGNGALRLSNGNGYNDEDGGLISNFTFPSSAGLQVTFTTYSYHGDSGGAIGDGADGMSFFLIDPTYAPSYNATTQTWTPYDIGAVGGSLGYTCTNETGNYKTTLHPGTTTPQGFDGVRHAYVAVGMDEYGNFQNGASGSSWNDNTASGPGYLPSSIAVRGPGDVAWDSLHAYNSSWYPSSLPLGNGSIANGTQAQAVLNTCRTGYYWNYGNPLVPGYQTTTPAPDYNWLAGVSLPTTSLLANENATQRGYTAGSFPPTNSGIYAVPIQYTLTITSAGLMNLVYSYNGGANTSVISNTDITNGGQFPLPAVYAFGFAGSTGGSSNIHEVLCFEAQPTTSSSSSAGLNEKQSSEIQLGTQVYFAYYNPNTWAGSMTADPLTVNSSTYLVSIGTPVWDASCTLTGGTLPGGSTAISLCPSTGLFNVAAQNTSASSAGGRQILTWNTATKAGVPFEWAGSSGTTYLSSAQATALESACTVYTNSACAANKSGSSTTIGQDRVNYLRGVRTNETGGTSFPVTPSSGGTVQTYFRARASVLGDIVDSSPTWVGPPIGTYGGTFSDSIYPGAAASYFPENTATTGNLNQYPIWAASVATRTNVVYVGANDGLMHGFSAGSYSNLTTYNTTLNTTGSSGNLNTGQELIAYIPGSVLNDGTSVTTVDAIHDSQVTTALDFTSPNYGHNWYIDSPPGSGDLYYGGAWHTWVVSGFGPGGQGLFILDGTNPANFSESNAASLVIGEWTSVTLPNCTNTGAACGNNLGDTYGVPQIRRFHNGSWGIVFGNGFGSGSGDAGVYIMTVNPADTTPTFSLYYLSTHTGSTSSPNGIAYTSPSDLDGDHIVDYIYAGDLQGHLWRFDVTSQNPSNWAVSTGGPLFSTGGQPITTKVTVASTPNSSGANRVIVSFGTGQKTPQTISTATAYATGTQGIYGIWDWNMAAWNALSSTQYASLASVPANSYTYGGSSVPVISTSDLQQQVITVLGSITNGAGVAQLVTSISDNPVCWYSSTSCSSGNTSMGWYMNLPGTNEQIVYSPVLQLGNFIVNSTIPAVITPYACTSSNPTGFTYSINPTTGGGTSTTFFGNSSGQFNNYTNATTGQTSVISGIQLNGTGSVSVLTLGGALSPVTGTFLVTQTSSGTGTVVPVNPLGNAQTTRLTWKELR